MHSFSTLAVVGGWALANAVTGAAAASAAAAPVSNTTCAESFYILIARGSGEAILPPGQFKYPDYTGLAAKAAIDVQNQIPGVVIGGVVYPALDPTAPGNNLSTYATSEANGTAAIADEVAAYTKKCPGVKIALLGYSQGAQVVQDALCGGLGDNAALSVAGTTGTTKGFNADPPMPQSLVEDNVFAIALIADPTHIANTSYDHGNSTRNGVFARTNTTACDPYVAKGLYGAWCQADDLFCDSGSSALIHTYEPLTYENQVAQFLVDRWNNVTKDAATPSGSGSPSGTASAPSGTATKNAAGRVAGTLGQPMLAAASVLLAAWLLN
ncbi:Axe2 [Sporothrix schenckii 1099-18]|uniref:Cutinase n=2 Tax=Sporothrix schenckii TaxID=29908 RepID=U7PJR6_SPOS1|nr:Axe2 [Sporothrix schenckii 1099-18]ERS95171.1 hypothetical protein HMPREF1624_08382 [Sporothrix schenckii ATCC 58251]KJR89961.1 Axe2 [Sporothrix schenckii 1099-18]